MPDKLDLPIGMMTLLAAAERERTDRLMLDIFHNAFITRPLTEEEKQRNRLAGQVCNLCWEISDAAEKMIETDPTLASPSVVRWLLEEIENLRCRAPWE